MILLIIALILVFIVVVCGAMSRHDTVVETIIEHDEPSSYFMGKLQRKRAKNGQYYVIDPVDKTKNWLNDKDDRYEDAAGTVWNLVDHM